MKVGIVGGGASCVALLSSLVNIKGMPLEITVFEKSGKVGPGLAYSTIHDSNILNMRADVMSVVASEPEHFLHWLATNHPTNETPDDDTHGRFPSRKIYGEYLCTTVDELLKHPKEKSTDVVPEEVTSLMHAGNKQTLTFGTRTIDDFDHVVLALGNLPSENFQELSGTPAYFHSPYPDNLLVESIDRNSEVIVLGSRLSAIDAAVTLLENGHQATVYFVSPSGMLPAVQGIPTNYELTHLRLEHVKAKRDNTVSLDTIIDLFKLELEEAAGRIEWDDVLTPRSSPAELMSQYVAMAQERLPWQAVLAATSGVIEDFWNLLSSRDRQRFLHQHMSAWCRYRHSMPLQNGRKIKKYLDEGSLKVIGGESNVSFVVDGNVFRVEGTREGRSYTLETSYAINGTGNGHNLRRQRSPLIQHLVNRNMVAPDPFGGIQVDFSTNSILTNDGGTYPGTSVLGPLTRGTHFYTNAIDRTVAHSTRIAKHIMERGGA